MTSDFKRKLWKAADKLRGQMDAAEYKHIVLGLIFLKYISDTFARQRGRVWDMVSEPSSNYFISKDPSECEKELEERDYYTKDNVFWVPQDARWETLKQKAKQPNIGALVDAALTTIEQENPPLRGKLDKRFGRTMLDPRILGELIDLISTIGFNKDYNEGDLLGEVYEYFLGEFAAAEGQNGGQFYTPSDVVKILVAILSPTSGRVYDPCCGSGGMFVQSEELIKAYGGRTNDISIYGQESNPTTWRLAAMNMAIRGFSTDLGKEPADTFARDHFPDLKFDYILANPPFNISDWGGEKYESDPRWRFGRPPIGNANYAWLQHILWKLRPGGQAGVFLANGSMSSATSGENKIRKAMIRDDVVEAMVALPGQLFLNTQIPVCLWFLTNDKTKNGRDRCNETLFIDARNLGTMQTRTLRVFSKEDRDKISETVRAWKTGENYKDIPGFCRSAALEEITKHEYVLTPGRYVGTAPEQEDDEPYNLKIDRLTQELQDLQEKEKSLDAHIAKNLEWIKQ
ncbi:MAG: SAM-dependent DNA methyltransferase [Gammaproteobacteria bacterium AqS3]|nr:SAM-dependent DNA methyltransferase [Gammaproteobacteria bacterium AqS3]